MVSELSWQQKLAEKSLPEKGQKGEKNLASVMRKSLTREQSVKKRPEIDAIFRSGKKFSSHQFKLIVAPNGKERNRVVVIPVKHYGNAVSRNRIRRQLREIWRNENPNFINGLDFAIVVYPGKDLEFEQQRKHLTNLFLKAEVYKSLV